jgi:hypothetical protein
MVSVIGSIAGSAGASVMAGASVAGAAAGASVMAGASVIAAPPHAARTSEPSIKRLKIVNRLRFLFIFSSFFLLILIFILRYFYIVFLWMQIQESLLTF